MNDRKRDARAVTLFTLVLIGLAPAVFAGGAYSFGYANPYITILAALYLMLAGLLHGGLRILRARDAHGLISPDSRNPGGL